jgi:hypothetical protein
VIKRIHILGASGSGTTTLGHALAARLQCPHFDTDAYFWYQLTLHHRPYRIGQRGHGRLPSPHDKSALLAISILLCSKNNLPPRRVASVHDGRRAAHVRVVGEPAKHEVGEVSARNRGDDRCRSDIRGTAYQNIHGARSNDSASPQLWDRRAARSTPSPSRGSDALVSVLPDHRAMTASATGLLPSVVSRTVRVTVTQRCHSAGARSSRDRLQWLARPILERLVCNL